MICECCRINDLLKSYGTHQITDIQSFEALRKIYQAISFCICICHFADVKIVQLVAIHCSLLLNQIFQVFFYALCAPDLLQQTFLASFKFLQFLQASFLLHYLATYFEFSVFLETFQSRVPKSFNVFFASNFDQSYSVSFRDFFLQVLKFFDTDDLLILFSVFFDF